MKATKLEHGKFLVIAKQNRIKPTAPAWAQAKYPPQDKPWEPTSDKAVAAAAERLLGEDLHRDELYVVQVIRVVTRKTIPPAKLPVNVRKVK